MKYIRFVVWFSFSFSILFANESWRNTTSIEADFLQEIKGERGAIPVLYKGKLYAFNNKVKWEYIEPLKKEVYLEKNQAYVYEPELKQVTIGSLKENVDFIHILKKVEATTKKDYYQTKIGDTMYFLVIKDSKPYMLMYNDNLDNYVTIKLENVKINTKIDSNIFIFQPPDDVEYIDANN